MFRSLMLVLCAGALVAAESSLIASLRLNQAPSGTAQTLAELRASQPQPGTRVVVKAQVGGRNPPWIPGRAMMILADAKELSACTTGTCGAPWDFCSAPADKLLQHTGFVRWLDNKGQPHAVGFDAIEGIAPLATVVVTGSIANVGDPRALVIDIDGLHVADSGPFAHLMR